MIFLKAIMNRWCVILCFTIRHKPTPAQMLWLVLGLVAAATVLLQGEALDAQEYAPAEESYAEFPPTPDASLTKEALKAGNYPWYDAEKDATRKVAIPAPMADNYSPANRKWSYVPKPVTTTVTPAAPGTTRSWGWLNSLLSMLGYVLFAAALIAIFFFAGRAFMKREVLGSSATKTKVVESSRQVDQVEKLPMELATKGGNFLDMVRKLMAEGNYSLAIIYLYAHQLVSLDEVQYIRLAKGKTNRQYLRELRSDRPMAHLVEQTILLFEDSFFGKKTIGAEAFNVCWQQLPQFESMLQLHVKRGVA